MRSWGSRWLGICMSALSPASNRWHPNADNGGPACTIRRRWVAHGEISWPHPSKRCYYSSHGHDAAIRQVFHTNQMT
ncbi:hypothetical protein F5Y08DRAFT_78542 [Xylaria arbuscula]|nr:hypothetical protein F5Y08DRAFT_78542 [Xylaria arbuscula]